jgi:hypothetical protein
MVIDLMNSCPLLFPQDIRNLIYTFLIVRNTFDSDYLSEGLISVKQIA